MNSKTLFASLLAFLLVLFKISQAVPASEGHQSNEQVSDFLPKDLFKYHRFHSKFIDDSNEHDLEKRRFNAWAGKRSQFEKRRFNAWAGR